MPLAYAPNPSPIYKEITSFDSDKGRFYRNLEAEFQISLHLPIYRQIAGTGWDLIAAHTHRSWWQVYNSSWSRPFRETNYSPEIFARHSQERPWEWGGVKLLAFDAGYLHQSNGQIQLISRSWDRVFGRGILHSDEGLIIVTAWMRLPEASGADDNPSIERRLGAGELHLVKWLGTHTLELKTSVAEEPNLDIQYSLPWQAGLRWSMTYSSGYGPSLIEYNRKTDRWAFGVTLHSGFDRPMESVSGSAEATKP